MMGDGRPITIPTGNGWSRRAKRREAERSALEQRAREFGRDDLAELLEAGKITTGEAFYRLHTRR